MPVSAADMLLGFVLPAVFAGGAFAVLSLASRESAAARFGPALAFVGGFLLGYFSLKLGPLVPEAHWHWLPSVMLLPLVIGPVSRAEGVTGFERMLLYGLVAAIAGWWLVPTWEDLEPSRAAHLVFWAISVVLLAGALEPLSRRISASLFALALFLTMVCGAGVLVLSGSLRFVQIAGAGAGALMGLAVACRFAGTEDSLKGLAIGFVLLLAGMLLVGRVNTFSSVPLASYLLVPLAPLSLWLVAKPPLSRLEGAKRVLVQIGLPLMIGASAIVLAAVAET